MHLQHTPGYIEAENFMNDYIARPDMDWAIELVTRAAAMDYDTFLASIMLRAYLGSTPTSE